MSTPNNLILSKELTIPRDEKSVISVEGFVPALAIALSAQAKRDNTITLVESQVLDSIAEYLAEKSDNPLLVKVLVYEGLFSNIPLNDALKSLKQFAKEQPNEAKELIFNSVNKLLTCQGEDSYDYIEKWASALDISTDKINQLKTESDFFSSSRQMFNKIFSYVSKREDPLRRNLRQIALIFEDQPLLNYLKSESSSSENSLKSVGAEAYKRIREQALANLPSADSFDNQLNLAEKFYHLANLLTDQIEQRLISIQKRLELQQRLFEEDLNLYIDASVDLVELGMRDLVDGREDAWADQTIWENFAKTDAANELQARYQPLKARYDLIFDMWNTELSAFSEELQKTSQVVLQNINSTEFAKMVSTSHENVKIKNFIDKATNATIFTASTATIVGTAGTAVALYTSVTTVAAVVATAGAIVTNPVGWAVGGVIGLSAIWKLFSNLNARKRELIADKRDILKSSLLKLLGDPINQHKKAVIELEGQYFEAASKYLEPIVREAHLVVLYIKLRKKVAIRVENDIANAFSAILE